MMQFRQSAHSTSIVASLLSITIIFACSGRTAAQTWRIDTQFVGIAYGNPQSMSSGPTVVENIFSSSYSSMAASPDGREISSVTNSPPTSSGGGLTSIIRARSTALKGNNGSINADHTLTGGLIHNTLYWLGDSQCAPTEVKVIFRRKVTVTVMAFGGDSTGASGAAMASASCGVSLNCQIASTGAEVHDSRSETTLFYEQILSVSNGQTSFSFPMSWSLASSAGAGTSGVGKGEATCEIVTDFIIAGVTFGRHPGSGLEGVGAGHSQGPTDPT